MVRALHVALPPGTKAEAKDTKPMEYFPVEFDYKCANFAAMCKQSPNRFERHLNEDGWKGESGVAVMWQRRRIADKEKDGEKSPTDNKAVPAGAARWMQYR